MVLGAVSEAFDGLQITARAGFTIPIGRTEEDPFAMPELPHQHIQFGTGTVNPVLAAEVGYGWGKWRAFGFAFTQQIVYENSKGYKAGDRYAGGLGVRRALGSWSLRGGVEMQAESLERWGGISYKDEGNQGRIDVYAGAGASWAATDRLSLDAALKIPFVNHVVNGQLQMPALLEVGATWMFGDKAHAHDDHDHEHDHEGEHDDHDHDHDHALDTKGADIADLGKNGAAVDLVPVPGKLTIFDFWAPWCEPCKTLEPVLVELAKKDPAHVAIRRIDVVDWDSAVVAQYLTPRGFDLPHVKIYDASGKLVFEQSSGPGKLVPMIESIRKIVDPKPATPATPPVVEAPPVETPPVAETPPVVDSPPADAPPTVETPPVQTPPTVDTPPTKKPPPTKPAKPLVVSITASQRGFEPNTITVPRGKPVTLQFTRTVERTCATEVIFVHDGKRELVELPLNKTVSLTVTFKAATTITYACGMNMFKGTIIVK
jgi:thiol-disulfide isomerase/thioredoxin